MIVDLALNGLIFSSAPVIDVDTDGDDAIGERSSGERPGLERRGCETGFVVLVVLYGMECHGHHQTVWFGVQVQHREGHVLLRKEA